MTIIYSQNFDSTTLGTLPSGWSPVASAAWAVSNSVSISASNSLVGPLISGDGAQIMYTGQLALADMEVRYDVAEAQGFVGVILRGTSDASTGYIIIQDNAGSPNGQWDVYKRISGSATRFDTFAPSGLSGNISVRARIQGSIISIKLWNQGTTEPGSWTHVCLADTSITAAGYPGFYNQYNGSSGGSGLDNLTLDNLQAAGLSVSPSSVVTSSIGNVLTLTGTGTAWTSGTPGSPIFTVSAGTITAQTVLSLISAHVSYSAPGSPTIVTIADPSTGATASLTVNAAATDFTLTPSSRGTTPGSATAAYTLQPNGTPSSSVLIALSDGDADGTFSPASPLTFNSNAPQAFTYTPSNSASTGNITLTAQASGSLTSQHTATCVVGSGPETIAVTNAALFWSPGNWDHLTSGTFGVSTDTMQATAAGAYLKFGVSGTVNLSLDIDNATNSGFASGNMPILRYSIDGASFTDVQLEPSQTSLVLSSSLSTAAHTIEVYFRQSSNTNGVGDVAGSSGVSPTNVVRINGIAIDSGGAVGAPTLLPKRMLIFGDSITAAEHANTDGSDDATQGYAPLIARALGAEFGQLGYGGQGWEDVGGSNAPAFKTFYAIYSVGRNRSFSGLDYVWVTHGGNDARASISGSTIQVDCEAWLSAIRTVCGAGTVIFVAVECMLSYASDLAAAVSAYKTASGDTKVHLIDPTALLPVGVFTLTFGGTTQWTYDGVHPLIYGHGRIGAIYACLAEQALANSSGETASAGYSRSRVAND